MDRNVKRSAVVSVCVLLLCALFFAMKPYSETANNVYAVIVLLLSVILVVRSRHHNLALIISLFLAYSNYSIVVGVYLCPELRSVYLYPQIEDIEVYGIGIAMLLLLTLTLVLFMPSNRKKDRYIFAEHFVTEEHYNPLVFLALTLIFCVIMIVGYGRVEEGRGTSSALYEYNVIVMVAMFLFSGNKKWTKLICCGCTVPYVLTSLTNGTRIEAIVCLIVVYLCVLRKEVPLWVFVVGIMMGAVGLNIIGIFRGSSVSFSDGLQASMAAMKKSKMVFVTCTDAYFPTLCMIEQFKEYSLVSGMEYLFKFIGTIFAGANRVSGGNLIDYTRAMYYHNFGGVVTGFFYVWFSYPGALMFGGYVTAILNQTKKRPHSPLPLCAVLYTTAMVPRWYLYGPWAITRGVMFCLVAVGLVYAVWKYILCHRSCRYELIRRTNETQS